MRRIALITEIVAPYRIPVFNALAQHDNIDLHVVFLAETDPELRQWAIYRDEINFSHEILPSWRVRAGKMNWLLNRGIRSALNRNHPDVIICGGYNYVSSWTALLWARRRRVPFILWSESNAYDRRRGYAWVEFLKAYFLGRCNGFAVPGRASLDYLRSLGAPADRIFIAPNAVDNCFFLRESEQARRQSDALRLQLNLPQRYILFVGRLVREKGVFDLLEAYAKLSGKLRSEVGLVFAGDGTAKQRLIEQAEDIQPGTVFLCGFAQREQLARYYGLAEALVLPTHSDPWGLVVNEGMACGLPIVVSNVAGCAADLVQDGWNGFVVRPGDSGELCTAISSLIEDPERRRRMGERSTERIQQYSPDACAAGLMSAVSVKTAIR